MVSSTLPYPPLSPRWAKEDAMRARKLRQRELFDDDPPVARRVLPRQVRDEALQLLTQWLHTLSKAMVRESSDEQDQP